MESEGTKGADDRSTEWFVPKFGPRRFRVFVGLLFVPYTAMVIAFTVIGAMPAEPIYWDRVAALAIIYFLALGIGAHALDALGSKDAKPWGRVFSHRQMWLMALLSLSAAYLIAIYYMVRYVPWLWIVAILEGFFVFAYNLEWFGGRLHTDNWFAFSWGFLPVLAGCIMQTNSISAEAVILAVSMALFSMVEIKASRPYKALRRRMPLLTQEEKSLTRAYEAVLKSLSLGIICLGLGLGLWRLLP